MNGKLICLTGLDASGKSTQISLLFNRLKAIGQNTEIVQLYHMDDPKIYSRCVRFIRKHHLVLNDIEIDILKAALNMREQIRKQILPMLEKGSIVVTDRYIEANYLFAMLFDMQAEILDLVWSEFYYPPDLMIFLNVSPQVCYNRLQIRGKPIKNHETIENLEKAYDFYLKSIHKDLYKIIDGEKNVEIVHEEIWKHVCRLININQI